MQLRDGLLGVALQRIGNRDDADQLAISRYGDDGLGLRFMRFASAR